MFNNFMQIMCKIYRLCIANTVPAGDLRGVQFRRGHVQTKDCTYSFVEAL